MSTVQAALTMRGNRTTAQDVGNEKVMAASSIAKSSNSLGAVGLDKMMVEVEHPADKVLVAALQDGTASVVMAETQDVSTDFDVNAGTSEFVDLGSEAAGVKDKVREKNYKAKETERTEPLSGHAFFQKEDKQKVGTISSLDMKQMPLRWKIMNFSQKEYYYQLNKEDRVISSPSTTFHPFYPQSTTNS